jgi:hypothetical protein
LAVDLKPVRGAQPHRRHWRDQFARRALFWPDGAERHSAASVITTPLPGTLNQFASAMGTSSSPLSRR